MDFTGRGGEGKSRIGVVMKSLLGVNMNVGSIAKLESSPFARADLQNLLLLVDDDLKMEALNQTNNIKSIITAELPMDLERKGIQSYQALLRCRLMAFGNGNLQALHDRSLGFFRRQIILTTRPRDPNRKDDPYLAEKLKEERSLLNNDEPFTKKLNNISRDLDLNIKFSNKTTVSEDSAQTIVLSSGNLGLIYFTDWSNRMTYEQIEDAFPGLINGLAHHEGIGFVMVKSDIYDTIVLSNDDVLYLSSEEYFGNHFLDKFGENTIKKLKRTDDFEYVPDILVNSEYDIENNEVYAFEELIGSHGGAGGNQQYPFILYPKDWDLDDEIFGAENVYKFFKRETEKSLNEK